MGNSIDHSSYVIALDGPYDGIKWIINDSLNLIGRDQECSICLPERPISRQHARIYIEQGKFFIQDLNTQNGTWVNGERIHDKIEIKHKDIINLASAFRLQFISNEIANNRKRTYSFRIFLSSPGDVSNERAIALKIIDHLGHDPEFRNIVLYEVIAWDKPTNEVPMLATMSPQEAINIGLPKPSECNIVIVILWSRMGTPLPETYKKPDGKKYLSGTEWEFWDAYNGYKDKKQPLLLLYRRIEEPTVGLKDPKRQEKIEQFERVEYFFSSFIEPDGTIKQGYNTYQDLEQFRDKLEKHLRELTTRLIADNNGLDDNLISNHPQKEKWEGSPFPGLRAFTLTDAPIFFGRDHETNELIKKLAQNSFVTIVGASGSGKSSVVGAGLMPRIINGAIEGSKDWLWLRFSPGGTNGDPFLAFSEQIIDHLQEGEWDTTKLSVYLREEPNNFKRVTDNILISKPEWSKLVVFIDQFEELFTQVNVDLRDSFIRLLSIQDERIKIIITLRSDFYHKCIEISYLATLFEKATYPLSAPGQFKLLEMIKKPAERANLFFEDGLPERIVEDTGSEPGALALMAFLLDELYERCKEKEIIHFSDYEALGRVQGAIGQRAESVFSQLDSSVQIFLPLVFRELIEVNESGTATKHRSSLKNIEGNAKPLLDAFIKARLFTADIHEDISTVEVSHEAIFHHWGRLREWIVKSQEDLILLRQVREAAKDWLQKDRPNYLLWPAERLKIVYEMQKRLGLVLDELVIDFIRPESDRLLPFIDDTNINHQQRSLVGERLSLIGDPRRGVGLREDNLPDINWCKVPGNIVKIIIKSNRYNLKVEGPDLEREISLNSFYISKYPITYLQYSAFLDNPSGAQNENWWPVNSNLGDIRKINEQFSKLNSYPRDNINWFQAIAFTKWLDTMFNQNNLKPDSTLQIRLPFEWEWQLAATGEDNSKPYPWGDWKSNNANTAEAGINRTTAVGLYPNGKAKCGALDMSGNIWEWCLNEYDDLFTIDINSINHKSMRGGSFDDNKLYASTIHRDSYNPLGSGNFYGFRVVCASPLTGLATTNIRINAY